MRVKLIMLMLGERIMMDKNIMNDIERVLISEEELSSIVKRIGKQITEDYADKNILLVSGLKGSVTFMADLMREINLP